MQQKVQLSFPSFRLGGDDDDDVLAHLRADKRELFDLVRKDEKTAAAAAARTEKQRGSQ